MLIAGLVYEAIVALDDLKPAAPNFGFNECGSNMVVPDFSLAVLFILRARPSVEDDQPSAGTKRPKNAAEDRLRIGELMIGIGDQHSINGSRGQVRICGLSQNGLNIVLAADDGPDSQYSQWKLQDIDGQNLP